MIKHLLVVGVCLLSLGAVAQRGTATPYSFYGLGTLNFKGTVENRSMGGMGVYLDSIHLNLRNPAAYVGKNVEAFPFDGESRPVKFGVAGTFTNTNLKSNSGEAQTGTAIFDYIAMSIPVGKFGFGLGLLPLTTVGYKLDDVNDDGDLLNRFSGEGGLNRIFLGMGYQITDGLGIGVDVTYNWGNIENDAIAFAYTSGGELVQFQTQENSRSELRGLKVNFGLSFKKMLNEKLELSTTFTYSPVSDLTSENERSLASINYNPNFEQQLVLSSIDVDLESQGLRRTDLTLPSRLSFGAGLGRPQHWFVGAEYTFQNSSEFSNPFYANQATAFENASQISVGGFLIPQYNAFSGYHKRIVYRAGFRFANTGLVIKDESINEFGISFGLGLPVGNRALFSNANIGLEYGQRGTAEQNLIQENFLTLNLSLSLNSRWFRQKKYN